MGTMASSSGRRHARTRSTAGPPPLRPRPPALARSPRVASLPLLSCLLGLVSLVCCSTLYQWDEYNEFTAWVFILVVAVMGGVRAYVQNLVLKYNSPLTLAAANILIQVSASKSVHAMRAYASPPRIGRYNPRLNPRLVTSSWASPSPTNTHQLLCTANHCQSFHSLTPGQALTIVVSIFVFDTQTSFELDCGIVVSLAGYALYTMQKTMGNKKKAPPQPDVEKGRCVCAASSVPREHTDTTAAAAATVVTTAAIAIAITTSLRAHSPRPASPPPSLSIRTEEAPLLVGGTTEPKP